LPSFAAFYAKKKQACSIVTVCTFFPSATKESAKEKYFLFCYTLLLDLPFS